MIHVLDLILRMNLNVNKYVYTRFITYFGFDFYNYWKVECNGMVQFYNNTKILENVLLVKSLNMVKIII